MIIPTQSGQGSAASSDYQSLYAAPRSGKSTFEQTLAQIQSTSFSMTTAEGDRVTLSGLSQNYQYTQAIGWFNPASSGVNYTSSSTTAETMGLSVQGDLNEQELADINRLVGELTSIASAFFSGDQETALTRAMDFGDLGLGSVSSLAASFSKQTAIQTQIASESPLPTMADLNDLNLKDLYQQLEAERTEQMDYAALLEARWQQILKTLDEMKAQELDGLFARRMEPLPLPDNGLNTEALAPSSPEEQPAEERSARRIPAHMEKPASETEQTPPFTAI